MSTTERPAPPKGRVIIDTREQRPYSFANAVRRALPAGDYSIEGLEHQFAVERKSLDDWVQTLLRGRSRFSRELAKLQEYDFAAIVIEASLSDMLAGNYSSKLEPASLLALTTHLMLEYQPIHILFAGDRPHAVALVGKLLELAEARYGGK